jgi:hypothetical protein
VSNLEPTTPHNLLTWATTAGEAAALGTTALTILGYMPQIAALFTVLWYVARFSAWMYRHALKTHDYRAGMRRDLQAESRERVAETTELKIDAAECKASNFHPQTDKG